MEVGLDRSYDGGHYATIGAPSDGGLNGFSRGLNGSASPMMNGLGVQQTSTPTKDHPPYNARLSLDASQM